MPRAGHKFHQAVETHPNVSKRQRPCETVHAELTVTTIKRFGLVASTPPPRAIEQGYFIFDSPKIAAYF